ncbi:MAG: polysaccharide biosynthesis tyrosine autokinase [Bacteroidales bacterium]|nr:polysaccharide biosynthesis tyrosine autokinase [Bacteroidales bacterium]
MIPESPSPKPYTRPVTAKQDDDIDLTKLFYLVLSNWYWFALALFVALTVAWLYLTHTLPTWKVSATVLIEEDKKSQSIIGSDKILEGFGVRPGMQNLDNQLLLITSWSIVDKVLSELPFDIEYYYRGRMNKVPLYPESPVRVYTDASGKIPEDMEFEIKLTGSNTFILTAHSDKFHDFKTKAAFGDTIDIEGGKMRIEQVPGFYTPENREKPLYFIIHSRDKLVESIRSRLEAKPASKEGTIINLSIVGTNKVMEMDFLDKLIAVFLNNNLERKNKEAVRTIDFIDNQLLGISDSLNITEDKLQRFRSANRVMDMSAQGQQIITQAMNLENEKAKLVIESNYYEYLAGYLSKDAGGELPVSPATMGITDPGLTRLVIELSDLQSQYFSRSIGDRNPMQAQIAQKLRNTRDALNETLKGVRHANELAMKENREQTRSINASAATLPRTERELLGIEREFKLNDVLYSFLLEKKAEAQIQKASNTPDNEMIDRPRPDKVPVSPKPVRVYLLAILAGLGLPFLVIIGIDTFDNTIKDDDDLKKITDLPIAGHIAQSTLNKDLVVLEEPSSAVAESFRSLRARIRFFTKDIKSPVILITSSMPDEGKTFTAINLASVYSLMGKKTLLMDFDLRKPKIISEFDLSNEKGLSTWLIGRDKTDEIIKKTRFDNLDIIPSGPIPPNPAELIASGNIPALLSELRELYDYIIIDSAPIGTVSDSLTLATFADATIILVRHGKTIKPLLSGTLTGIKANGINGTSLLLNDIQYGKIRYGNYARYGSDYGYSYHSKETKVKKTKV